MAQEKNHFLFIVDLNLFERTEKQLDTVINKLHIYDEEMRMEFGISKCGILIMQKGKLVYRGH